MEQQLIKVQLEFPDGVVIWTAMFNSVLGLPKITINEDGRIWIAGMNDFVFPPYVLKIGESK